MGDVICLDDISQTEPWGNRQAQVEGCLLLVGDRQQERPHSQEVAGQVKWDELGGGGTMCVQGLRHKSR